MDKDCKTIIRFAKDEIVNIFFEAFNVEFEDKCSYDFLAVHDGNGTDSPMIGSKMCGTDPEGTTMHSSGNLMTLHFHSDWAESRSGFKIYANDTKG